jgi:hypothetical protein
MRQAILCKLKPAADVPPASSSIFKLGIGRATLAAMMQERRK